ncbi:hypothetical protein ABN763_01355 [Spongiivirga sp. MCCC 1A20706]|uniref:hypothetical protein n=1 Tax=Spongiivirga sp. MCCC 1A20706 TaxID=3160963 RepID=UPI003977E25E
MKVSKILLLISLLSFLACSTNEDGTTIEAGSSLFTAEVSSDEFVELDANNVNSLWFLAHDTNGKLLNVTKATVGENELRSNTSFSGSKIYFTIGYVMNSSSINFNTFLVNVGGRRSYQETFIPTFPPRTSELDINITVTEETFLDSPFPYNASGFSYGRSTSSITNGIQNLKVSYTNEVENIIIVNNYNRAPFYNGRKEGYKYYNLNVSNVVSPITLSDISFNSLETSIKLEIHNNELDGFHFRRWGYESKSGFDNYRRHDIYEVNSYFDYIDLPIIDLFLFYENVAIYKEGPYDYYFLSFGNDFNIDNPNWTLTYSPRSDGSYEISSENDGDFYKLEYNTNGYLWKYFIDASEPSIVVPRLKLPDVIAAELEGDFYTEENVPNFRSLEMWDYVNFNNYDEFIQFRLGLIAENSRENGGYKYMRFTPFD